LPAQSIRSRNPPGPDSYGSLKENDMMGGGMMWGMGLLWLLALIVLVMSAAALIKYLRK
jgi:uncharacterized membrane protein